MLSFILLNLFAGSETTVDTLDLEKYQGRWYQIYGNNFDQLFEKYSSCITADYTLVPNGNVSVLNGVPHDAPYWVYNLGPESSGFYDWAIVSDPLKLSLFVLARDVDIYYEEYDVEVTELLNSYGFDNLVTVNHANCEYAPEP